MSRATRIDIVTVRDPDYENSYAIFINGVHHNQDEPSGAYASDVPFAPDVRVEMWTIDLGADDITDPALWKGDNRLWWMVWADEPNADSDITVPQAVRDYVVETAEQYRPEEN